MGPFTQSLSRGAGVGRSSGGYYDNSVGPGFGRWIPRQTIDWDSIMRRVGPNMPGNNWLDMLKKFMSSGGELQQGIDPGMQLMGSYGGLSHGGTPSLSQLRPDMMQGMRQQYLQRGAPNGGSARGGPYRPKF